MVTSWPFQLNFYNLFQLRHSFLILTNLTCEYWHCPITFFSFSVYISKFFSLFLMTVIVLKKYILIWLNVWRDSWKVTNNRWEIHPQIFHFISFLLLFHRCSKYILFGQKGCWRPWILKSTVVRDKAELSGMFLPRIEV